MEERWSRRKSLRVPVSLDVKCELAAGAILMGKALNLGTEGIFIKLADPIDVATNLTMEFLLPDTLNSIRLAGETVWTRSYEEGEDEAFYVAGVKFLDLEKPFRSLLQDYIFRMLDDEEMVRSQGILRVLDDIRNLPSLDRLEAYKRLIKRSTDSVLE